MTSTRRPDGRAARWHGQHERRRAQFVDAALAEITERGPEVSTERIAQRAGVARTRLYKHFDGAADLQATISGKVVELLSAELEPVWKPSGSPQRMITAALEALVRWLTEHTHLYRYVVRHSPAGSGGGLTDIKTALGQHLTGYLRGVGMEPGAAEITAFGVVGHVESATARWLDWPGGTSRDELVEQLAGAVWAVFEQALRRGGIELDPLRPLDEQRGRLEQPVTTAGPQAP